MSERQRLECGSPDHELHRRQMLQGSLAASTASLLSLQGLFTVPAIADEVKRQQKRCILLWLCGAPSQFETWDPKPGRKSSGPFGAISTRLPGVRFCELMPKCAGIADQLTVIRSMKTDESEHFQGDRPLEPRRFAASPFRSTHTWVGVGRAIGAS